MKIKDFYSIYDRAHCSKCGTSEFLENKKLSIIQRDLICDCKGCGDIHTWSSRISSDEWRKKIIDKILDNGNR